MGAKLMSPLQDLLATLMYQRLAYQAAHWAVVGKEAYSLHLLFQRLYEALDAQVDTLAEKLVALEGPGAVDVVLLTEAMALRAFDWNSAAPVESAWNLEHRFQMEVKRCYEVLKAGEGLTLGLDDFLMALSSEHDTNVYLLGQLRRGKKASELFSGPRFFEVLQFAESGAISNDLEIVENAHQEETLGEPLSDALDAVDETPPTPEEILDEEPAGDALSTLSRYLVDSELTEKRGGLAAWAQKVRG